MPICGKKGIGAIRWDQSAAFGKVRTGSSSEKKTERERERKRLRG